MKGSTSKSRNRNIRILVAGAAGGLAMSLPQWSQGALLSNVAFNDVLASNGSTLGAASQSYPNSASPTTTSTNYDIASSKDATASTFTGGSPLALKMVSTSGGINEVQAVFTSSPVVLSTIGQEIEITATFKNAAGLNQNSSSSVDIGLYNSGGGNTPYNNLYDTNSATAPTGVSGLATANAPQENSGGVQPWNGYETDSFGASSTKIYTRPSPAVGTNNTDQALVAEGQTGGSTGTLQAFASQNSTETTLVVGNTYTDEMSITLTGTNLYTISEALYNGSTDTGTEVGTTTTTTSTVPALSSGGFDGLALGLRESDSLASEMDISQVEITDNVPEPATLGILALTGLGLMKRKRRA